MVAGEQRAAFAQGEAQVIAGMARRGDGLQRPAVAASVSPSASTRSG
jgi:hypothetical protein